MKHIFCIFIFLFFSLMLITAQEAQEEERGLLVEIGAGPSVITYGAADAYFSLAEENGANRVQLNLHALFGYAVATDLYLCGVISGAADRFTYSSQYLQMNIYILGAGVRYYPFTTGLVLGADFGASPFLIQTNTSSPYMQSGVTASGLGFNISLGYDFGQSLTGFALKTGIRASATTLEGSIISSGSFVVTLVWK
ncbi:MAG: hypothetical protein ACLFR1_15430 [Spirochaetia bacterium]